MITATAARPLADDAEQARRIDALPDQFRTVFMLRDVEEMSVDETAECLDVPAATVLERVRLFNQPEEAP